MNETLTIANSHWRLGILPDNGACVRFGQARLGDDWVDVLRPTPDELLGSPWDTASYPLVPWSNRIRDGLLLWNGESYQLRRWGVHPWAMHGTAVEYPWEVVEQATDRAVLEFDARGYYGVNWPWDFVTRVEFALERERLVYRIELENVDEEAFPAGIGHHPYFVRRLRGPDGKERGEEARLQVNTELAYDLDDGIPAGAPGPIPKDLDYRVMRELGDVHVDSCQAGRTSSLSATIEYSDFSVDIESDDIFGYTVVYVPKGESYFAVEPVTNANDAFTLAARGVERAGVIELGSGEKLSAEFAIVLR